MVLINELTDPCNGSTLQQASSNLIGSLESLQSCHHDNERPSAILN